MPTEEELASRPRLRGGASSAAAGEAARLYTATSSRPLLPWGEAPEELLPYLQLVYGAGGYAPQLVSTGPAEPWGELRDDGSVWVSYTGGKDSLAVALLEREAGRQVRLWHLAGLNRGMGDELRYAARSAGRIGLQLHVQRVSVSGKKAGLIELPTKNQVSTLLLAGTMAEQGGATYVAGWHASDVQAGQAWDYDWSDGADAVHLFQHYLAARLPGITYRAVLEDTVHALATVARHGLVQYIKSCVTAPRYKARVRDANLRRFGWLLAGRCGSCVKCAAEEYTLQQLGVLPRSRQRLRHAAQWLVRDFGPRLGVHQMSPEGLQQVLQVQIPPASVERWRREPGEWPAQPAPADEHHGTPDWWTPDSGPEPSRLAAPSPQQLLGRDVAGDGPRSSGWSGSECAVQA